MASSGEIAERPRPGSAHGETHAGEQGGKACRLHAEIAKNGDNKDDIEDNAENVGEFALQGGIEVARCQHMGHDVDGKVDEPATDHVKDNCAGDFQSDRRHERQHRHRLDAYLCNCVPVYFHSPAYPDPFIATFVDVQGKAELQASP